MPVSSLSTIRDDASCPQAGLLGYLLPAQPPGPWRASRGLKGHSQGGGSWVGSGYWYADSQEVRDPRWKESGLAPSPTRARPAPTP